MVIEIVNWDKHNPKRDQKSYSWLKLSNDISTDPDLYGIDAEQKFVWITILCQASKKMTGTLTLNLEQISDVTKVSVKKIHALLTFLQLKPIIVVHATTRGRDHDNARSCDSSVTTPTKRREENEEKRTEEGESTETQRANALPPLAQIWNEHSGTLAKVTGVSTERRRKAEARWREKPEEDYWAQVVQKLTQSAFCTGDNQRGWRANFDFLIKPDTHLRVLEGQYDQNRVSHIDWSKLT